MGRRLDLGLRYTAINGPRGFGMALGFMSKRRLDGVDFIGTKIV